MSEDRKPPQFLQRARGLVRLWGAPGSTNHAVLLTSRLLPMTFAATAHRQASISAGHHGALRVGVGGPVGSGKTALVEALCKRLRDDYDIYVITNDIYTK